jgi:fumarylacetoacetase
LSAGFAMAGDGRFVARTAAGIVEVPGYPSLDALLAEPRPAWLALIAELDSAISADRADQREPIAEPELVVPFSVRDYVDFYSSLEHATNLGRLFRPDTDPLLPNWRAMPVGYHGRASTVVVSGTAIRRPQGQIAPGEFAPTRALDIEVELGFVMGGAPNPLGVPIPIEEAGERIFGIVLLNDWSARDIQRFEYQPLGPFLGKAFATSISPWVVPIAALEAARVPGPRQDPEPLPYLRGGGDWNFEIELEVELNGELIASPNARGLYWSAAQQVAHLASGGAVMRPGDLLGTGTISGVERERCGSLIEMRRPFLADSDEVVIRGRAGGVDLGELAGTIAPSA